MNRDDARNYFKSLSLNYTLISKEDIEDLSKILSEELSLYYHNGGEHAKLMGMTLSKVRVKDVKFLNRTGLEYAYLHIDGSYFKRREGISFNQNGFIGFGGEFSDINVAPILKSFCRWCDTISNKMIEKEQNYGM